MCESKSKSEVLQVSEFKRIYKKAPPLFVLKVFARGQDEDKTAGNHTYSQWSDFLLPTNS